MIRWNPRKYVVYKSKYTNLCGGHHRYKSQTVEIFLDGKKYKGTFYITTNWVEIRTDVLNIIVPLSDCVFYKNSKYRDTILTDGQSGSTGLNVVYTCRTTYSDEDIQRFKDWKIHHE